MSLFSRRHSRQSRKPGRSVPRIEALELRYAPACTTNYNVFLQDLSVTCDSGNDFVDVDGTSGTSYRLTVNGVEKTYKIVDSIGINTGSGNDNVRIMPDSKNLNGVGVPISVNGGAGFDIFSLHDQNSTGAYEHVLTGTTHQRTGTNVVSYDDIENRTLTTGISAANTVRILGSPGATSTLVSTGNAQDTFYVGSAANSLTTIQGALILNGGSTEDSLYVTDTGITAPATYTLRNTSVQRSGSAVITFGNIYGVRLYAGNGSDTINVQGVPVGSHSVWGNGGNDNIVIGSTSNSLDSIDGALWAYGGTGDDSLEVVDSGNAAPGTYEVFQTLLTRSGVGLMHYDSIQNVNLSAGQGDDAINVYETCCTNDTATTSINAGAGDDAVRVSDPYFTLTGIWDSLSLAGGSGTNVLDLDDSGSTIDGNYAITTNSVQREFKAPVAHAGFQTVNLQSGSGNDRFAFADGAGLPGSLSGGAGADVLDYSAFTTDIAVNLFTASASGIGSIGGIEHVIAGSGNDILVGDAANNDLLGGGGRDLIIGGAGADALDGGEADDLLISGATAHDNSPAALTSIQAIWTLAIPYNRRSRQVKAWLNGSTVFGDGAVNNVNGQADMDLFYLGTVDTSDWNPGIGEIKVQI